MTFATIVLDGAGVGDAPDAAAYGDEGANTLESVCAAAVPRLPNLERWGLGAILPLRGVAATREPAASYGRMTARAAGKDSTTGHWELAGVVLDTPFPLYPDGFPQAVVDSFCEATGADGMLGNKAASGTAIIDELGAEHEATGRPIVYTSGDSVFQIAAHTSTIPLDRLYRLCQVARANVCVGEHAVGRVIARPFEGEAGAYRRLSAARKDFALRPPQPTLQEALQEGGVRTVAIGKIASLFAGVGFDVEQKTADNDEGIARTVEAMTAAAASGESTFIWTNLVDFDEQYGHRNDAEGFARALEHFDAAMPALARALAPGGRVLLTADHGNDPCFLGTDHTRERVPLLLLQKDRDETIVPGKALGTRAYLADHAASVAAHFGVSYHGPGASFLTASA